MQVINPNIIKSLREMNINTDDGILFLLSKRFDLKPSYIPSRLEASINRTGIYELDKFNSLQWNIPLFDGEEVSVWDWVKKEYRQLFKQANPDKSGNGNDCVRRIKKLFQDYPEIRKEDVIEATRMYINNTDSRYLMFSHYFIEKGKGSEKTQNILTWIERYREENLVITGRNQMQ